VQLDESNGVGVGTDVGAGVGRDEGDAVCSEQLTSVTQMAAYAAAHTRCFNVIRV